MDFLKLYKSTKEEIKETILGMWKETSPQMITKYGPQLENIIDKSISDNIVVENMAHWKSAPNDDWKKIVNPLIWRRYKKDGSGDIEDIPFRPYKHQFESWETLLTKGKSIVVTSGTGSGKTECFMVPLIHDLTKNTNEGRNEAVEAIFLYPLNALMEDQKERLNNYITFSENDLKFAVYNGNTPENTLSSNYEAPEYKTEIGSRDEIRKEKPNILLTNPSMLEYMLLRENDRNLFSQDLKWIVIDETHTFKGSAGAELAMLIRRILKACGKHPSEIKFATSSATIGNGPNAKDALKEFISNITGQDKTQIEVIEGERNIPTTTDPTIQHLLFNHDFILLKDLIKTGDIEYKLNLLDNLANNKLRVRLHYYLQAMNYGLYVNLLDIASGAFNLWGHIPLNNGKQDQQFLEACYCTECGAILGYGEMDSDGKYTHILKNVTMLDENSEESNDEDGTEDEDNFKELSTNNFYIGLKEANSTGTSYSLTKDGQLIADVGGLYVINFIEQKLNKKTTNIQSIHHCPCCGAHGAEHRKPIRSFHMSGDFLSRLIAPILLEQTTPADSNPQTSLPSKGCKYISFADSRQSVAGPTIKQNLETEEAWVSGVIYKELHRISLSAAEKAKLKAERDEAEENGDDARVKEISAIISRSNKGFITWLDAIELLRNDTNSDSMYMAFAKKNEQICEAEKNAYLLSALYRVMSKRPASGKNSPENWGLICTTYPSIEPLKKRELPECIKEFNSLPSCISPIQSKDWYDFVKLFIDYDIRTNGRFFFEYDPDKPDYANKDKQWRDIDIESCRSYRTESSKRRPINGEEGTVTAGRNRFTLLLANLLDKTEFSELNSVEKDCINDILLLLYKDLKDYSISEKGRLAHDNFDKNGKKTNDKIWNSDEEQYMNLTRIAFKLYDESVWFDNNMRLPLDTTFMEYSPYRDPEELTYDVKCGKEAWSRFDINNKSLDCHDWWKNFRKPIVHKWTSKLNRILEFACREHNTLYIQAEHTAQVARSIIKKKTQMFKDGELNIMACSTTMEMGVDLGDLELVVMNNIPPHPANYKQRAGRAGRGDQFKSASVTICGSDSIGKSTMANPLKGLICRPIEPPKVVWDSPQLIQRHINSFLFRKFVNEHVEGFQTGNDGENDRGFKVGMFFTTYCTRRDGKVAYLSKGDKIIWPNNYSSLLGNEHNGSLFQLFIAELDTYSTDTTVLSLISDLIRNTGCKTSPSTLVLKTKEIVNTLAKVLDEEFSAISSQWTPDCLVNDKPAGYGTKLNYEFTSLFNRNLLTYLSTHQFTPNANMPVGIVEFILDNVESHVSENPSRDMKVALSEYAPGRKVFIDGTTYISEAVRWNRSYTNINIKHCANHHTWTTEHDKCPICAEEAIAWDHFGNSIEMITPTGFYPSKDTSRITTKDAMDLKIGTELIGVGEWIATNNHRLYATRTNRDSQNPEILYYNKGYGKGYYVCKSCGYAVPIPAQKRNQTENELITNLLYQTDKKGNLYHSGRDKLCKLNKNAAVDDGVFKHVVLGGTIQTDYCEIALFDRVSHPLRFSEENLMIGTTLGLMLCRKFAALSGFDRGEIDFIVRNQDNNVSICIYDTAKGGSGYSKRLNNPALIEYLFDDIRREMSTYTSIHQVVDRQTVQYAELVDIIKTLSWLDKELVSRQLVPLHIQHMFKETVRVADYNEVESAIKGIVVGQECYLFFNGDNIEKWNYDSRDINWRMKDLNSGILYNQRTFVAYDMIPTISTHAEQTLKCASNNWKKFDQANWPKGIFPLLYIDGNMYFTDNVEYTSMNENWAAKDIYSVKLDQNPSLGGLVYNLLGDEHYKIEIDTRINSDELFDLIYNGSERLRKFIENASGHKLDFYYHEEYMKSHLVMTMTLQFIKGLAKKAKSEIGCVFCVGEEYEKVTRFKPKQYDLNEDPKPLGAQCLSSELRDSYFRKKFLNKLKENHLIDGKSDCLSLSPDKLPHYRLLEVRDSVTGDSIQILPNGGFGNGWEMDIDNSGRTYYTDNCDVTTPIPIKCKLQPILYDIKVGSDLNWDFLYS